MWRPCSSALCKIFSCSIKTKAPKGKPRSTSIENIFWGEGVSKVILEMTQPIAPKKKSPFLGSVGVCEDKQ